MTGIARVVLDARCRGENTTNLSRPKNGLSESHKNQYNACNEK